MDKKLLIDDYLQGRHPIEGKSWELPTEGELDRDEALYEALLAEREKAPLLGGRFGGGLLAAAAVLVAVFALFTWKSFMPQTTSPTVAQTEEPAVQEDTLGDTSKHNALRLPTRHVTIANTTRYDSNKHASRLKTPRQAVAEAAQKEDTVVLANAADSLYYYLTQLENQMGDCRDSTCLAELTGLMRADERIKTLVQKIIHKQVETAYQEEYLVDTTTRYVPL